MAKKKKKKDLPWEYCECGCHGSELSLGGLYFWSIVNFPAAPRSYEFMTVDVHGRHGWLSNLLAHFEGSREETQAQLDDFVRQIIRKNLDELKEYM